MAGVVGSEQTGSITSTPEVDRAADELYTLPPSEFVAARKRLVDSAGDRGVAKAIGALRRPTVAAWAVNLVVRGGGSEWEEALELGELLREAQRRLHGSELRRLDVRRREMVGVLTSLAESCVGGLPGDALEQVRNTFIAAMADEGMAAQVCSGRLVKGLEYSGFGPVGEGAPVDDLSERREMRRERRLVAAREAAAEAAERVEGLGGEVKAAVAAHALKVREVEELKAALRDAERGAQAAGKVVEKVRGRLEAAQEARAAALGEVEELSRGR
ncbi:hypothetical protein [Umezawaea sp. NPDC059074]|uniref:hypothetical protein n=1 Tax=Umezawaea sp. NPDC059074 TaxID=3346716 RepID=UPI0036A05548